MLITHIDERSNRRYRIGIANTFADLPSLLGDVSPHFMLFLAVDANLITNEVLRSTARKLLDRGLAYVCVWGNDCERVHDQFDLERASHESDGSIVMTTWHSDEQLSEALWFFANEAYPDDDFTPDCHDWVAVSLANLEWQTEMNRVLVYQHK